MRTLKNVFVFHVAVCVLVVRFTHNIRVGVDESRKVEGRRQKVKGGTLIHTCEHINCGLEFNNSAQIGKGDALLLKLPHLKQRQRQHLLMLLLY